MSCSEGGARLRVCPPRYPDHVSGYLLRYRIATYVVGSLLIVLVCVGVPLKYLAMDGTSAQSTGEWITTYLGIAHGWLYMVFLVLATMLARAARWSVPFTAGTLLLGTVPFLSFYAERRATARTREVMTSTSGAASASTERHRPDPAGQSTPLA